MKDILRNAVASFQDFRGRHHQKKAIEQFTNSMLDLPEFTFFVVLASVLASFALLQGNEAVIIGAMIITPFINPLAGLSLAFFAPDWTLFQKALIRVIIGVTFFFGIAYVIGMLFPPDEIHELILLRAQPLSVGDICIAVSAGLIAALSLALEKISTRGSSSNSVGSGKT